MSLSVDQVKNICFFSILLVSVSFAQVPTPRSFETMLNAASLNQYSRTISNSVTDIVVNGNTIWLGTGKGLHKSTDGGRLWKYYFNTPEFGTEDVSAIAVKGNDIWVATAHSVEKDDQSLPEGSGLRYSSDGGTTWKVIPQPVDVNNVDTIRWGNSIIRALGITTAINNITYDIAITDSAVYIVSFAGMARKTTDKGASWERVVIPPDNLNSISQNDSLRFDLSPSAGSLGLAGNLNHRAFSVHAENDSTIWIGTAGGINKTTNGGRSWTKFTKQNQIEPISGNFVVAISHQKTATKNTIWAATVNASDNTERRGVSYTDNGGLSWKQGLIGEFVHNFGFKDSIVYVPTDDGFFRSTDQGVSWIQNGTIYEPETRRLYTQKKFYSSASYGDSIWFGGIDGIVTTIDNASNVFGARWQIIRAVQQVNGKKETYAYPNPFAPDDEIVRLHYSTQNRNATVTVRVFDFGMNLVRTVVNKVQRNGQLEQDEIWDGKSDSGTQVANGVYFYHVVVDSDEPVWGKILVIQ